MNTLLLCTSIIIFLLLPCISLSANSPAGPNFKIGMVRDLFLYYTTQDTYIYNGVTFWANWVNNQVKRYESFVKDYQVDLFVSPYTTGRSVSSVKVSDTYKIINLMPGTAADMLINRTDALSFTALTAAANIQIPTLELLVSVGAKNYVMIRRPDAAPLKVADGTIQFLAAKQVTQLACEWVNTSTTDTSDISVILRKTITNIFSTVDEADMFIYAGLASEFPTIVAVFAQVMPKVKSAIFLMQNSPYDLQAYGLEEAGKYWITCTNYVSGLDFGVSGELGGTTADFEAAFYKEFDYHPNGADANAASVLMTYYRAVNLTQSIDAMVINTTMKTMGPVNTFARIIDFYLNGTNKNAFVVPIQYVNGIGQLATTKSLIYPAPFDHKTKLNVKLIVAIAVPVGALIVIASVAGAWYMRTQRAHVVKALVEAEEGERRNYKIDYSALSIETAIGAGGFGVVYKGDYRGAEVAIKKLKAQKMSKSQLDEFAKESAVMIGLRHPMCVDPPELCIVTELMPRGSLYDIIHNDKIVLPFPLIKSFILDSLKGLQFIHSANLVHRDLKSPNLLVDRSWNVKIADFGLSATKAKSDEDVQISLLWAAPEILKKEPGCYSEKSDMYSFGIIMWELLARKTPYTDLFAAAIAPAVVKGHRPVVDYGWDSKISQLMTKCWDQSSANRPSVVEARLIAETVYSDPSFEIGSSSGLVKYVDKASPPSGTIATFVYTTVYNSVKLWEYDPHLMMRSLTLHNEILRQNMLRHDGHEVKTDGESFLIAFGDQFKALNFCLTSHQLLMEAEWSESLLQHPDACLERNLDNDIIARGLYVNMGVHTAQITMEKNSISGRFEYFSPDLGIPGLLARTRVGKGWIGLGAEVYQSVMASPNRIAPFIVEETTPFTYKGRSYTGYQMVLKSLHERDSTLPVIVTQNGDIEEFNSTVNFEFPPRQEKWVIKYEDLELKERIGSGSFGEVKLALMRGKKYAVKQIVKQKLTDTNLLELHSESGIISQLNHPNVLAFVGVCLKLPNLCLVTEYMDRGSLDKLIFIPHSQVTWGQKIKMASGMVSGLLYLHDKGIIHRDIKMSNMLVANDFTIKIADFGYSRMRADNQTMTQVGTVSYSAPEIFEGGHYSDKADVYSLGIMLWELIANKKAWDRVHGMKIVASVTTGGRPSISDCLPGAPQVLIEILQECWAQDPVDRPPLKDVAFKLM